MPQLKRTTNAGIEANWEIQTLFKIATRKLQRKQVAGCIVPGANLFTV
jgi:hypothetical protein